MWSENKSVTNNLTHVLKLSLHLYDEQLTTSKDKLLYGKTLGAPYRYFLTYSTRQYKGTVPSKNTQLSYGVPTFLKT